MDPDYENAPDLPPRSCDFQEPDVPPLPPRSNDVDEEVDEGEYEDVAEVNPPEAAGLFVPSVKGRTVHT